MENAFLLSTFWVFPASQLGEAQCEIIPKSWPKVENSSLNWDFFAHKLFLED
jgi:hypothetical protein